MENMAIPDHPDRIVVKVGSVAVEARDVLALTLVPLQGRALEIPAAGSHVRVHLPNGLERSYSLCAGSGPASYKLAVGYVRAGNGGSRWIHEELRPGQTLEISRPIDAFPVNSSAKYHLLIAGGIGITPFTAMVEYLETTAAPFKLIFCARSRQEAPFLNLLERLGPDRFSVHFSSGPEGRLDFSVALAHLDAQTHVYCCGPTGLMHAVRDATAHLANTNVHFEAFGTDPVVDVQKSPCFIRLNSTGELLEVPANRTVLEILHAHHADIPSLCETGSCGTCVVGYEGGEIDHQDFCLSKTERATLFTPCVSRLNSRIVTVLV
ncbi:ferredoxin-NADP reductase [Paraburkholderia sp. 32]